MKAEADDGLRLSGRAILAMLAKEHSLREREFAGKNKRTGRHHP